MATVVVVPKTVREKLGDDGADDLLAFLNNFMDQKRQEITTEGLYEREKQELRFEKQLGTTESRLLDQGENMRSELTEKIETVRSELTEKIETARSELTEKIESVRSELKVDIAQTKSEIIKWMFIFWTGSVVTILGGLLGFLSLFFSK